ncbi:MAG: 30S ribosomal protein S6 [Chloroflexota bacterium]|nr:30S ribosomal protein S6 [Chloroflexota bacterium]
MREYELMAVYDLAVVEEGGQDASVQHLTSLVERNGGSVTEVDHWGRRRLAYPMNKQLDADFIVTRIELDPQAVKPLNADFEIEERVYRHLVVRADELPPPRPVLAPAGSRGPGSPTGPRFEGAPEAPPAPAPAAPAETAPAVEAALAPDAEAAPAEAAPVADAEAAPVAEAEAAPVADAEAAPAVEAETAPEAEAPEAAEAVEEAPAAEAEAEETTTPEEEAAPAPEASAEESEPQADDDTAKE